MFAITDDENNKKGEKEVTCFKCKKVVHYSNECDKVASVKTSNKKGSSFLVLNMDEQICSSEEEENGTGHTNADYR